MTIRKNAKFLDATERENLVRAFIMMRADIVNPGHWQKHKLFSFGQCRAAGELLLAHQWGEYSWRDGSNSDPFQSANQSCRHLFSARQ